ncbi:MAG: sigma-70 family RNA polymerase sigma factor [Terracidiphilus sp.]
MSSDPKDEAWVSPDHSPDETERLVQSVAQGDRNAEREFVERYQPRVRAMLLARTRNSEVTADLVQDVIIEALCALRRSQLREASKLTPFVLGIARNVLNSHFRAVSRQPESLELPDDLPDLSSAASRLEDEERESAAMQAISSLEPVDRTILHMTLVDGLKPGMIAQRLRLKPDVVRQRKMRATRRLIDFVRGRSQNRPPIHIITGQKR